jgi:serine protease Do
MPIAHPHPSRPRGRAPLLATVAILGLLAGGAAVSVATETPAPANAALADTVVVNAGYADLVAAVKPAVVNVRVERTAAAAGPMAQGPMADPEMRRFFERFFGEPGQGQGPMRMPQQPQQRERGEGSGFIVSADGLIVTNAHVAGGADKITISLDDGSELPATLKGIDEKTDLALLKVEAGKPLPYVTFGDSSKVRVGEAVVAVGNPFGLGGTVTAGIVSATGREIGSGPYDDFLQIDAPINRGNSGGPLFDARGRVIGINAQIRSDSGTAEGVGFAIPINTARRALRQLDRTGEVAYAYIGITTQDVTPGIAKRFGIGAERGALVASVEEGTPAAQAGIEGGNQTESYNGLALTFGGDVIVRIDGITVASADDVSRIVTERLRPGQTVPVELLRNGTERRTVQVTLAKRPLRPTN